MIYLKKKQESIVSFQLVQKLKQKGAEYVCQCHTVNGPVGRRWEPCTSQGSGGAEVRLRKRPGGGVQKIPGWLHCGNVEDVITESASQGRLFE